MRKPATSVRVRPLAVASGALLAIAMLAFAPGVGITQPGTLVTQITVPVAPSFLGVGIAADCSRNLYYTYYQVPTLYKMDRFGTLLASTPLTEPGGASVTIGEIAWDNGRQKLWGATDDETPRRIFLIDPVTALATYQFSMPLDGDIDLVDGLAYDAGDNSLWISPDVSTRVYHFSAAGAPLGTITPTDPGNNPLGDISGVSTGLGVILYLGRNGNGQIVESNKTTGGFIASFFSPGGRDEGLECDQFSFAPKTVLWSKDAYDHTVTAIEVDPLTCSCGGIVPTRSATWGEVKTIYR